MIANTNGCVEQIQKAVNQTKPDTIFHLGNGVNDLGLVKTTAPIYITKSNKDHFLKAQLIAKFQIEDVMVLCTYGHKEKTQKSIKNLLEKAKKEKANLVLFGCGEKTYLQRDEITFVNPGEIKKYDGTCIVVDINKDKFSVEEISLSAID